MGLGSALSLTGSRSFRASPRWQASPAPCSRDAVRCERWQTARRGGSPGFRPVPAHPAGQRAAVPRHVGAGADLSPGPGGIAFACPVRFTGLPDRATPGQALLLAGGGRAGQCAPSCSRRPRAVATAYNLVSLALAVAAGSFAWLLFIRQARSLVDLHADGDGWSVTLRRMLMLLLGAALTASVITGYPALVGLLAPGGDRDRIGASLFAALVTRQAAPAAIWRGPRPSPSRPRCGCRRTRRAADGYARCSSPGRPQ